MVESEEVGMPWVWTDELAELMDRDDTVNAADLRRWKAQPIGLAVPPECDLTTFGRQLLGSAHPAKESHAAGPDCSCGRQEQASGAESTR
jgi:hypothetical protein